MDDLKTRIIFRTGGKLTKYTQPSLENHQPPPSPPPNDGGTFQVNPVQDNPYGAVSEGWEADPPFCVTIAAQRHIQHPAP